jgi:hypothetical protein
MKCDRQMRRVVEVVLAGDAVKDVGVARATPQRRTRPRIGAQIEIPASPRRLAVRDDAVARLDAEHVGDGIRPLGRVEDGDARVALERCGDRLEDGGVHRVAHIHQHPPRSDRMTDGSIERASGADDGCTKAGPFCT